MLIDDASLALMAISILYLSLGFDLFFQILTNKEGSKITVRWF